MGRLTLGLLFSLGREPGPVSLISGVRIFLSGCGKWRLLHSIALSLSRVSLYEVEHRSPDHFRIDQLDAAGVSATAASDVSKRNVTLSCKYSPTLVSVWFE
jgi:hypothetical protein